MFVPSMCEVFLKRLKGVFNCVCNLCGSSIMEHITTSLRATVSFLEKNKKLDKTVYESIETTQVEQLLSQLKGVSLSLEDAGKVTESIHLSGLSEYHKNALCQALSNSASSIPNKGQRVTQRLLVGFKNYLTKQDRAMLSDEGQHPYARASIVVKRMIGIGLYMPCEKSIGHIVQTCAECFSMAGSPQEKHALLDEIKRQLKVARDGLQPKLIDFPADPRSCPGLNKAFDGRELMGFELAAHKPGKWLRGSSKQLKGPSEPSMVASGGSNDVASNPFFSMLYNFMMHGQQQNSGANHNVNLRVYPKKVKALQDGAITEAAGKTEAPAQTEAAPDTEEPAPKAFEVPALPTLQDPDSQVDEHLERMNQAFQERPKAEPKAKAKAGAKGAAKSKAKAKAKAKSKAKAKASAKAASKKRPCMIPQGGATCYYRQGKIHRSDAGECWRVFRKSSDRCDLKVNWKGNPQMAWQRALAVIEEAEKM